MTLIVIALISGWLFRTHFCATCKPGLVGAWECLCVRSMLMFVFILDRPIHQASILVAELTLFPDTTYSVLDGADFVVSEVVTIRPVRTAMLLFRRLISHWCKTKQRFKTPRELPCVFRPLNVVTIMAWSERIARSVGEQRKNLAF